MSHPDDAPAFIAAAVLVALVTFVAVVTLGASFEWWGS